MGKFWVVKNLLALLPSPLLHISIGPDRIGETVEHLTYNSTQPIPRPDETPFRRFLSFQALTNEFEIPDEDMAVLDNIENDPELKMVTAERMRKAINSDEPDGYKLKLYDNVYPADYATNGRW